MTMDSDFQSTEKGLVVIEPELFNLWQWLSPNILDYFVNCTKFSQVARKDYSRISFPRYVNFKTLGPDRGSKTMHSSLFVMSKSQIVFFKKNTARRLRILIRLCFDTSIACIQLVFLRITIQFSFEATMAMALHTQQGVAVFSASARQCTMIMISQSIARGQVSWTKTLRVLRYVIEFTRRPDSFSWVESLRLP